VSVENKKQEVSNFNNLNIFLLNIKNFFLHLYVLIKPGVISLVIFTALCAIIIAPSDKTFFIKSMSLILIAMGASGAAILNMWHDRGIDGKMERTKLRPIPSGGFSPNAALAIGLVLSVFSVVGLFFFTNIFAAALLAFTIIYYSFLYTVLLKSNTPQNIVIGGLAGALPPVIAWISISDINIWNSIIMCLIIFLWTPPHSWALAIYRNDDYSNASVPMYPVIHGFKSTFKLMNFYTLLMVLSTNALFIFNYNGVFYFITSNILNAYFVYKLYVLNKSNDPKKDAIKLFGYSILYLFLIFFVAVIDKLIN
jgi:protoheme IX farnesyltransferase|tara:strand:- start:2613 stop:3542 length:930 start_codon:yes stop_codon:yes gene_type:complete